MVSATDDSQPSRKAIGLCSCNYIWSSFSIGYRLVFNSLWTQQYSRGFIARYTNVGDRPRWSASKNRLLTNIKNWPQDRLATRIWPTRKRSLYFAFPWRRVWVDSSSDGDRRIEAPAPRRGSARWHLWISSSGGKRRASKNEGEWGRQKETKCSSCQR